MPCLRISMLFICMAVSLFLLSGCERSMKEGEFTLFNIDMTKISAIECSHRGMEFIGVEYDGFNAKAICATKSPYKIYKFGVTK